MRADVVQGATQAQEARIDAEMARVRAEISRAQAEQARAASEIAAAQARGELRDVKVVRGPDGQTTVHLPDGRVVTIDQHGSPVIAGPEGMLHEPFPSPPLLPSEERGPPENVIVLIAVVLCFVAMTIVGLPIARAFARRLDRKAVGAGATDLDARLQRIEQAVEAVAVEVERVSEAQRFSARLLAERAEPQPTYGAGPTRRP